VEQRAITFESSDCLLQLLTVDDLGAELTTGKADCLFWACSHSERSESGVRCANLMCFRSFRPISRMLDGPVTIVTGTMRKIEATLETIGQVAFGKDENPKKPRGHG
jgi:hypothetical protein